MPVNRPGCQLALLAGALLAGALPCGALPGLPCGALPGLPCGALPMFVHLCFGAAGGVFAVERDFDVAVGLDDDVAVGLDDDVVEVVDVDAGRALPWVAARATAVVPAPSPPARTAVTAARPSSVPFANAIGCFSFPGEPRFGSHRMKDRRGSWRQPVPAL